MIESNKLGLPGQTIWFGPFVAKFSKCFPDSIRLCYTLQPYESQDSHDMYQQVRKIFMVNLETLFLITIILTPSLVKSD